jgi:2-amino-4-hydroxy-6-hydroxymethyldihydropteridine diphosphokinase
MSRTGPARAPYAFIGIGSNLEDPVSKVQSALRDLDHLPATRVVAQSSLYRTAPVGMLEQPPFINAVAKLQTALDPKRLLAALFEIEQRHGRVRSTRNAPRTLDLDLLLFGDQVIDQAGLTVPHPRMHERAFVLAPLVEIAPDVTLPGRGSAAQLLAAAGSEGVSRIGGA